MSTLILAHFCSFPSVIPFLPPINSSLFISSYFQLKLLCLLYLLFNPPGSRICISFLFASTPMSSIVYPSLPHTFLVSFFLSHSPFICGPLVYSDTCVFFLSSFYLSNLLFSSPVPVTLPEAVLSNFPRKLEWTAPIETLAHLIYHRGIYLISRDIFPPAELPQIKTAGVFRVQRSSEIFPSFPLWLHLLLCI